MKDIIEKYKGTIKKIIINITGYENEDVEQEVYIKTWKNIQKYEERNKFKQWISAITSNACKDFLRKSKKINEVSDEFIENMSDKDNIERNIESIERQKRILKEINKLPKKLKETIIYYELENKSYEEISILCNVPIGTIKSRLYNAREALRENLQDLL